MAVNKEIVEKIQLPPHNLNNDIGEHILDVIKKKYLNKCTKDGYIENIIKIVKRSNGQIENLDFEGYITYTVRFEALISKPKENEIIKDCNISLVNQVGIFAEKDFLSIIITSELLPKGYEKKYEKEKKINIKVNKIKFELTDKKIRVLGTIV